MPESETETETVPKVDIGRTRGRFARLLRRIATASALAPVAIATVELVTNLWKDEAWLSIWRRVIVAGPSAGIGLMILAALVYGLTATQRRRGTVALTGDRLDARTTDGRVLAQDERVTGAVVVPSGTSARAELALAGGDTLHASFPTIRAAETWLERLGVDPSRRAVSIPGLGPASTTLLALGTAFAACFGSLVAFGLAISSFGKPPSWIAPVFVFSTVAVAIAAVWANRPAKVRIGVDGVVIERRLGARTIPFRQIAKATTSGRYLELRLVTGETVSVRMPDGDLREAALHRIDEARAPRDDAPTLHDVLAKAGRTVKAWRDDLRTWARGGSAFRSAAPTADELHTVLVDPAASGEARVGAALALRESGGEARVRIAAEASASPKLRVALETIAAASDDDEAIEDAVRALEAEG